MYVEVKRNVTHDIRKLLLIERCVNEMLVIGFN